MVDKFKKRSFYLFNTEDEYVCRPIRKFYSLIHPQLSASDSLQICANTYFEYYVGFYCAEYYRIIDFCHMLNRFGEFCFHSFPQNYCMFIKKCQWDRMSRVAELSYKYLDMYSLNWTVGNCNISAFNSFPHFLKQNVCIFLKSKHLCAGWFLLSNVKNFHDYN